MENNMTVFLGFRCTPEMKQKLEAIAEQSVAKDISAHIRAALEQYIELHEPTQQPITQPN